jgi:hypothetical protein
MPPKPPRGVDIDRIKQAKVNLSKARVNFVTKNNEAKKAKKEWEGASEALERVLEEEFDPQPSLFRQPEPSANGTPASAATPPAEDTAWRDARLDGLGLADSLQEKLFNEGLETIGELSDWLQPKPGGGWTRRLTDIAGIGEGNAEKVMAALDRFWDERRKQQVTQIVDCGGNPPYEAAAPAEDAERADPRASADDDQDEDGEDDEDE